MEGTKLRIVMDSLRIKSIRYARPCVRWVWQIPDTHHVEWATAVPILKRQMHKMFLKNPVFCLQRAQFIYPLNSGSSAPMLYQNPFRMACCSGGIDHISEMSRACNLLWIG